MHLFDRQTVLASKSVVSKAVTSTREGVKSIDLSKLRSLVIPATSLVLIIALGIGLWLYFPKSKRHPQTGVHPVAYSVQSQPNVTQTTPSTSSITPANSPSQNMTGAQTTPAVSTPNQAQTNTMPNTGPGTSILFTAIGAGLMGGVFSYIRRWRTVSATE